MVMRRSGGFKGGFDRQQVENEFFPSTFDVPEYKAPKPKAPKPYADPAPKAPQPKAPVVPKTFVAPIAPIVPVSYTHLTLPTSDLV